MCKSSYIADLGIMMYEDVILKHFLTATYSSIGTYLQPANQLVKSTITFGPIKIP